MKKMIIAATAFLAMTGMAMADPLSSTDELMGSAASGAAKLSNMEMAGVSGGDTAVSITAIFVRQTATASTSTTFPPGSGASVGTGGGGAVATGGQPTATASNSAVITSVNSASVR